MVNRWFVPLLLMITPLRIMAQDALSSLQLKERNRLELFAYNYAGYFTALNLQTPLSSTKFATSFFVGDTVNLTNDFSLYDPPNSIPSVYYQLLKQVFIKNPLTRGAKIHVSPPDSIVYLRSGDRYFICWHKQINYRYGRSQTRHFASWELLSLIDLPYLGFRIYGVSKIRRRLIKAPTLPAPTLEASAPTPVESIAPTPDVAPAPPPHHRHQYFRRQYRHQHRYQQLRHRLCRHQPQCQTRHRLRPLSRIPEGHHPIALPSLLQAVV